MRIRTGVATYVKMWRGNTLQREFTSQIALGVARPSHFASAVFASEKPAEGPEPSQILTWERLQK